MKNPRLWTRFEHELPLDRFGASSDQLCLCTMRMLNHVIQVWVLITGIIRVPRLSTAILRGRVEL